jgi:hypothetical protein
MDDPNALTRPSKLSLVTHIFVIGLLGLSFVSGTIIWYGQNANEIGDLTSPLFDPHSWRTLHGILNPFLCAVFGFLVCQHIRLGWKMKANRLSGFFMEVIFALLILTGAGIYYSPEAWQTLMISVHRVTGLLVPLSLTIHWIAAQIWIKKAQKSAC